MMRWTPGSQTAEERADRIRVLLDWADVVVAYDHPFYLDAAVASGKPVLFRALGGSARDFASEIRELLRSSSVVRASAGLAELALLLDVELAGAPYPLLEQAAGGSTICHAPADRELKRTDVVLRAAAATGWHVDLVEGVGNEEALERKRRAAVVVDSGPVGVPDGYGVNSIEAMALGLPAVSGASRHVRDVMRAAGSPVVLVSGEDELRDALAALREPALREALGVAGRRFVAGFHDGAARAAEDLAALTLAQVAA